MLSDRRRAGKRDFPISRMHNKELAYLCWCPEHQIETPAGTPASTKLRSSSAEEARVFFRRLGDDEQPAAKAALSLRTIWLIGTFQGVNAATGPVGSLMTS